MLSQLRCFSLIAVILTMSQIAHGQDSKKAETTPKEPAPGSISFMKDVAPIFAQNCVACHNPKKAESRYDMTTFTKLKKGGTSSEGGTLSVVPAKADESFLVELIQPDGEPRMPFKLDPLKKDQITTIENWIKQGANFDGGDVNSDWTITLRKSRPILIPEKYPAAMPITAVNFTPDGSRVAISGYHEVNLWKAADADPGLGSRLRTVGERTYEIAYSPDGKWLAIASGDPGQSGSAKLFSTQPNGEAKFVRDLVDSSDSVLAVAFSPDSKQIAAAGADRAIRLWEVETGKAIHLIEDHADWVLDIAFSPDGKRLASASRDKTSKVFDLVKKESLSTFPGHAEPVYAVEFLANGQHVASAGGDGKIRVWDSNADAKEVRAMSASSAIFRLAASADRKTLVACGQDKVVRLFNPENGQSLKNLEGHKDFLYSCAISKDGSKIVSGGYDGEVKVWNIADGKVVKSFLGAPGQTLK